MRVAKQSFFVRQTLTSENLVSHSGHNTEDSSRAEKSHIDIAIQFLPLIFSIITTHNQRVSDGQKSNTIEPYLFTLDLN